MQRYPDCTYNGDFYCNHVYDPAYPWQWIDFRFFHSRVKRYYAVAMITTWFDAYNRIETAAFDALDSEDQPYGEYKARLDAKMTELAETPVIIRPSIELKDYGRVAIGLWATVNTPFIDEHYIRKFIADFRERGEPTKPGWSWHGEEIEIDVRRTP